MSETKFVNGMWFNKPNENAPDFVIADINISVDRFIEWLNEQEKSEKGIVRITGKRSKGGKYYAELNDWKPAKNDVPIADQTGSGGSNDDDLPF